MALVPDPGVAAEFWSEVCTADVVDLWGKAQEPALAVGPVGFGGRLGEAVFLRCTVEQVERTVLDVRRLLHQRSAQDQVGGRWRNGRRRLVAVSLRRENRAQSVQGETWLRVNYADHLTNKPTTASDVLPNRCIRKHTVYVLRFTQNQCIPVQV